MGANPKAGPAGAGQALPEWSEAALRAALEARLPELAHLPLVLGPELGAPLEVFRRGTAQLGDGYFLKAAWSEPAAAGLLRQARLLLALDPVGLPIQRPLWVTVRPLLVVHRRLPGVPLSWERTGSLDPGGVTRVGGLLAGVLAELHSPETRELVDRGRLGLPRASSWCQASSDRLRHDLAPRLDGPVAARVAAAAGWAEAVLAERPEGDTFVHGDFHGWNLLVDDAADLFEATVAAYPRPLERRRVLAWHLLTDLGDALWRVEQGVPIELGPLPRRVTATLDRVSGLAGEAPF